MNPQARLPTTERLGLRRFTADDFEYLVVLNSDPEVMRHLGGVKSRADTETFLHQRVIAYYDANPGLGIWACIERSTGACIGMHLLNHIQGESHIQVGYVLSSEFWGRGYATEMSQALVQYGFVALGLDQIVGITDLPNIASQRVLEKSGLRRNGERAFAHPAYAKSGPLAWFERDRVDWLAEASV